MKQEYTFTLKFKLPPETSKTDDIVDALYAQGCDDALIGTGMPGQIALEFVREAETADEAVTSALQDVLNTIPKAQLIEAEPDYVGLTDIAEHVSVSRQQMRKLYESNACFPAPAHIGKSTLWNLVKVLGWLKENKDYVFSPLLYDVAKTNAVINAQHKIQNIVSKQERSYATTSAVKRYSISINTFFADSGNACFVEEMA